MGAEFPRACTFCGEMTERMGFYAHPASAGGRMTKCKECVKAAVKAYRAANLAKVQEYDRQRASLPHRRQGVKNRAHRYIDSKKKSIQKMRQLFPEKFVARNAVRNALRDGKIVRPAQCDDCHQDSPLQGHHDDYSKPLDVAWLCTACHGKRHKVLNEQLRLLKRA